MQFINEHKDNEKDGINITLFDGNKKSLVFYITSNKNKKFELELNENYGPNNLKFEGVSEKEKEKFCEKNSEIIKQLNNKSIPNLSDFFKKIK